MPSWLPYLHAKNKLVPGKEMEILFPGSVWYMKAVPEV